MRLAKDISLYPSRNQIESQSKDDVAYRRWQDNLGIFFRSQVQNFNNQITNGPPCFIDRGWPSRILLIGRIFFSTQDKDKPAAK